MTTRWRSSGRNERTVQRSKRSVVSDDESPLRNSSRSRSLMRPVIGGILFAAACLYISNLDFTAPTKNWGQRNPQRGRRQGSDKVVLDARRDSYAFYPGEYNAENRALPYKISSEQVQRPFETGDGNSAHRYGSGNTEMKQAVFSGDRSRHHDRASGDSGFHPFKNFYNRSHAADEESSKAKEPGLFDGGDAQVVRDAVSRYAAFANAMLATDQRALEMGKPLQGKYLVLEAGNELANRLRGVLSGFLLGILTDRVFVAEISYQKDATTGLLSTLFEGPGYQWDLSQLPMTLRRELKPNAARSLTFDMKESDFHHWLCVDVLGSPLSSFPVVTLSTVVYPLPLLVRNPTYASHPLLAGSDAADNGEGMAREGFASGRQGRIEALETLLTRIVLRPTQELRKRASDLAMLVRDKAAAWGESRGIEEPPRVVGLHIRTYFVKAVSQGSLQDDIHQFAACASQGGDGDANQDKSFFFVATDMASTQELAKKTWGDRCYFVDFSLPGSKREGILSAFVDLLVMGSLDDFVITPHSSFSELGSSLSYTWLPDYDEALRTFPNRPLVPMFPRMESFERRKVESLLDRRARLTEAGREEGGRCMRLYTAGMSLAVAKGTHLKSMFETIQTAQCLKDREKIADV